MNTIRSIGKGAGQLSAVGDHTLDAEFNVIYMCVNRALKQAQPRDTGIGMELEIIMKALKRLSLEVGKMIKDKKERCEEMKMVRKGLETKQEMVEDLQCEVAKVRVELEAAMDPANMRIKLASLRVAEQREYQEHLNRQYEASMIAHSNLTSLRNKKKLLLSKAERRQTRFSTRLSLTDALIAAVICVLRIETPFLIATRETELRRTNGVVEVPPGAACDKDVFWLRDALIVTDNHADEVSRPLPQEGLPSYFADYSIPDNPDFAPPGHWTTFSTNVFADAPPSLRVKRSVREGDGFASQNGRKCESRRASVASADEPQYLDTFLSSSESFQTVLTSPVLPMHAKPLAKPRRISNLWQEALDSDSSDDTAATVTVVNGVRRVTKIDEKKTFWGLAVFTFQYARGVFQLKVDMASLSRHPLASLAKQAAQYGVESLHEKMLRLSAPVISLTDILFCDKLQDALEEQHTAAQVAKNREAGCSPNEAPSFTNYKLTESGMQSSLKAATRKEGLKKGAPVVVLQKRFRQRGCIEHVGTDFGSMAWVNPYYDRTVVAQASSVGRPPAVIAAVTAKHVDAPQLPIPYFCTANEPLQSVTINIGTSVVIPQAYSFASARPIMAGLFPRSWRFEGSLNGEHWDLLRRHVDDTTIMKDNPYGLWSLPSFAASQSQPLGCYYKYFRITQEGPNSMGSHELQISCFEVYGRLLTVHPYCRKKEHPVPLAAQRPAAPDLLPMPQEELASKKKKKKKKK